MGVISQGAQSALVWRGWSSRRRRWRTGGRRGRGLVGGVIAFDSFDDAPCDAVVAFAATFEWSGRGLSRIIIIERNSKYRDERGLLAWFYQR